MSICIIGSVDYQVFAFLNNFLYIKTMLSWLFSIALFAPAARPTPAFRPSPAGPRV